MNDEQIAMVKSSWSEINSDSLTHRFYQQLFSLNPELEDLFLNNAELQREKFRTTLAILISSLDDPTTWLHKARTLGVEHAGYGVTDAHYDQVQTALLTALCEQLGLTLDSPQLKAWQAAYTAIAEVMRNAEFDEQGQP